MKLVRKLPASDAASDLVGPAVDLAVGPHLHPSVADEVRTLAEELLSETAARASSHTVEFAVSSDARSVHLEVRWAGAPMERAIGRRTPSGSHEGGALKTINGLADRWGLTHRDGRHCLWVEKEVDEGASPNVGEIEP